MPGPARSKSAGLDGDDAPLTDVERLVGGIGPKVRQLRQQLGLSLQQMAGVSGISAASIHKIERGEMVPTITTLLKLATAFGRPLNYFVDEDAESLTSASYVPSGTGTPQRGPHPDLGASLIVSGPLGRFRLSGWTIEVSPGSAGSADVGQRSGEDLVHVLEGHLEVTSGTRDYTLRKGDTLHVLANQTLSWGNPGRRPAKLYWVHSPAPS